MKVLTVSDQVVERMYSLVADKHFDDVDLLFGCGDLPYEYLEYIVTLLNKPLFYVPGNHDPVYSSEHKRSYAEGGLNIDRKVVFHKGLLIAGLGGSIRYRPDGVNQYTQREMYWRVFNLLPALLYQRIFRGRKLDVLITHSPPFGIHDDDTQAHEGLKALNWLVRWAQPRYLFHGHTHFYRQNLEAATTVVGKTTIMNIYPYKVIEVDHAI